MFNFAYCSTPIFIQDWQTQLFDKDTGEELYPEAIELIRAHARLLTENTNLPGDSAFLQGNPDLKHISYLGMTNLYYDGLSDFMTQADDIYEEECFFYHSTDPSSLVGWRTNEGVELHWTWDYRFVRPNDLVCDPLPSNVVDQYILIRKDMGSAEEVTIELSGVNSYTDSTADAQTTYSYRVKSVKNETEYDYTPTDFALVVEPGIEEESHFWHEKRDWQEAAYKSGNDSFDWEIVFVTDSEPQPDDIELEIYTDYDFYRALVDTFSIHQGGFLFEDGKVVFSVPVEEVYFLKHGGLAYRLKHTKSTGEVAYYPPSQLDEDSQTYKKHFYLSSINNRVMGCAWKNYKMRIEGEDQLWRAKYVEIANELGNGVYPHPSGDQVSFDGIFMDSVYDYLHYNEIRPYEYQGSVEYLNASNEFVQVVATSLNNTKLYPNPHKSSLKIMEALEGYENVGGVMYENWPLDYRLNQGFLRVLWLAQKHPEWQIFVNYHGADFNNGAYGVDNRSQLLAAFLAVRNDQFENETLLGFGDWTPDAGDPNPNPDFLERVNIFPEQLIQLGASETIQLEEGVVWPSAAEVDVLSSGTGSLAISWLESNTSGYVEEHLGHNFIIRRTEHLEGDETQHHYIWSIISVGSTSLPPIQVNLQELLGDRVTDGPVFRLALEDSLVLLSEGGFFSSSDTMYIDDYWEIAPGEVAIFFEVPIATPVVAQSARDALPAMPDMEAVLVVHAQHWDNKPLNIRIDGSEVGLPAEIFLHDDGQNGDASANDNFYSWAGPNSEIPIGRYYLPCRAIGSDGLRSYTKVAVFVVGETHVRYQEESEDTQLNYPGQPYSSVALDFDGTGPLDLFISFVDARGELFKGEYLTFDSQVPVFARAYESYFSNGVLPPIGLLGLSAADIDNDGDDDLFAASASEACLFLHETVNSLPVFNNSIEELGISPFADHSTTGNWADFDRDGQLDLFIGRSGVEPGYEPSYGMSALGGVLLKNDLEDGSGFVAVTDSLGSVYFDEANCMTSCWADIDRDGDLDLFVGEANDYPAGGPPPGWGSRLYINDGFGQFTEEVSSRLGIPATILTNGAVFEDMNNDGFLDLVLSKHYTPSVVMFNDGSGFFPEVLTITTGGLVGGLKVYDHNLNGESDVLFLPDDPSLLDNPELPGLRPHLMVNFLSDAEPCFKNLTIQTGLQINGKIGGGVVADFNSDGDPDLFLGKMVASNEVFFKATSEYRDDDPVFNWLQVKLESPNSINNRQGIGANVTVWTAGETRTKIVDGGSGRGSQDPHILTFGVGTTATIDSVTVDWPNGHHQAVTVRGSDINSEILISDSSLLEMVAGRTKFTYEINPESGTVNWVFNYETQVLTLGQFDFIELDLSGVLPACDPGMSILTPNSPDVQHSVSLMKNGKMAHQLIWMDRECVSQCDIPFTAHSGLSVARSCSDTGLIYIKVCPVLMPPGGM